MNTMFVREETGNVQKCLNFFRGARQLMPILLAIAVAGCQHSEQKPQETSSPTQATVALPRVSPVRPERKTLVRRTEQPGELQAFEETPLHAKVSGYVQHVLVDIGDRVRGPRYDTEGKLLEEGQVLVEISVPELEAERNEKRALVSQSSAEIQQALAAVDVAKSRRDLAQAALAEVEAAQMRDQAHVDRWKSEHQRMVDLGANKAVSRKVVEETENQFRAAEATRDETLAKIKSAKAALAEHAALIAKADADHQAAEARLNVARAEETRLETLCGFARIRAPYDGFVTLRGVHTGHLVRSATATERQPLLVVVRTDTVRIFIDIPESDALLVDSDDEAQIRIPSLSAEVFPARVTRTAWVLNAGTRTLKTELDVENSSGKLRPGMYAYAELKLAERPDALALPKSSVITQGAHSFCLCIDAANKIVKKQIEVGIQAGHEVEIVSGLEGDENVIAANVAGFQEGQEVQILQAPQK